MGPLQLGGCTKKMKNLHVVSGKEVRYSMQGGISAVMALQYTSFYDGSGYYFVWISLDEFNGAALIDLYRFMGMAMLNYSRPYRFEPQSEEKVSKHMMIWRDYGTFDVRTEMMMKYVMSLNWYDIP